MFKVLLSGGIVMIPIILCGILSTYIIVERFIFFKNCRQLDDEMKKNLDMALIKHDYLAAESAAVACQTPLGTVVSNAMLNRKLREEDMRELAQNDMDSSASSIMGKLGWLGVIANVSTLLGLFGTVCGNIKAFGILGQGGFAQAPAALSNAIGIALISTAAGLFVAIPTLVFSCYLKSLASRNINEMERFVTTMMLRLTGRML